MDNKQKKICYILPKFDLKTDTHYFYLYDFINAVAEDLDLALIIEKSESDVAFFKNIKNIYAQKFSWMPLRVLENLFLIILMRAKGYNNFYVHYSYVAAFNAGLASRLSGAKTFYWSCGMMWLFGRDRALSLILKLVNYLVTGVHALKSGYARNYKINENKIKIMPNWIDLERFKDIRENKTLEKYNLYKNKNYILFVHRLAKRKGAHYIIPVAKEFLDNKNIEFLVAGDGPYKEKLEQEIKNNNINNIKLIGRAPNKEVPALMKISKLFFMPSEEEGFPRALLEAMASGRPYVAFDIGGVREISPAEEQDFIYKIGDIKAMIKQIRAILNNNNLYNKISNSNLEHVKKFDISAVKNRFIEIISY